MTMTHEHLDEGELVAKTALNLIARILGRSDKSLADALGWKSAQMVQKRRSGETRIRIGEIPRFAAALGVPESLFDDSPDDILRWFADAATRNPLIKSQMLWPVELAARADRSGCPGQTSFFPEPLPPFPSDSVPIAA